MRIVAAILVAFAMGVGCASESKRAGDAAKSQAEVGVGDGSGEDAPAPDARPIEGKGLGPQGPQVLIGSAVTREETPPYAPPAADEAESLLVVIDTPYQIFEHQGTYVHVAAWRTDGSPAKDASVFVGKTLVGKADAHGSFVFQYPPKGDTEDGKRSAIGANTITVVDASEPKLQGSVPFNPMLRTGSFASDHLYVYADRGVYRPGGTIKLRSIGWHLSEEYEPLVEKDVEFTLRSPGGEVMGGTKATTDEFGVSSTELAVPASAPEGLYVLEVAYEQARQQTRLQIREFKPPQLQLDHTLGRFVTAAQPDLAFEVFVRPSNGSAFGKGTLAVIGSNPAGQAFAMRQSIEGDGPHAVKISKAELAKLKNGVGDGQYVTLKLGVSDDAGRSDEIKREMRYARNPYVAVLKADKDQYSTGDAIAIIAKVKDLDGVPLKSRAIRLESSEGTKSATTNDQGAATFALRMGSSSMSVKLFIDGVKDPIATTTLRWVAPRAMVSRVPEPVLRERQTAKVEVRFPADIIPAEKVVHMDVIDTSGALVNAVLIPIEKEEGGAYIARGEFTSPSWGSMLLTFFALGKRAGATADPTLPHYTLGLMTEGQNMVIQPDKTLTITLDGIPDELAPGQSVEAEVRVESATGEVVPASVGAALVDGRVLSLKDPLEITPMDIFYEPTLRTMSTTGSKILSWPVVSRNWGARVQDVALPPFPFLEGGRVAYRDISRGGADGFAMEGAEDEPEEPSVFKKMNKPKSKKSKKPKMKKSKKPKTSSGAKSGGKFYDFGDDSIDGELVKPDAQMLSPGSVDMDDIGVQKALSSKLLGSGPLGERLVGGAVEPKPVQITIRTRFPETALWRPHVRVDGQAKIAAVAPDAMAEQEFVFVASDKRGGVGIARKTVRVTQPLFVRADMPEVLRLGERVDVPVEVVNARGDAVEVEVAAESGALGLSLTTKTLKVAAKSSAVMLVRVAPTTAGALEYKLAVTAKGVQDIVEGKVRVVGSGVPTPRVMRGVASAKASYTQELVVPRGAAHRGTVSVGVPAVTAALVNIDELTRTLREDPLSMASDLATAAMMLQYAQRHGISSPALERLKARVTAAATGLKHMQRPDGSFGYWRNGRSSAYITAWVLEGLLETQELDVRVDPAIVQRAGDWLCRQAGKDGEIAVDEIAFWEGAQAAVREGITAEAFDAIARIPAGQRTSTMNQALKVWQKRYAAYLMRGDLDPLAAGRALQAMHRVGALKDADAAKVIAALELKRDTGHWEPSWFHAYAGRVEATAAMIAAMQRIDPERYAADIRDALKWVMGTRSSWGQWHNERATASALRAIIAAGVPAKDIAGTIVVKVDGEVVSSVTLDPRDPFLSTMPLRQLDLGRLSPGMHTVEVTADTTFDPAVVLTSTTWERPSTSTAREGDLSASVKAPATVRAGQSAAMQVKLGRGKSTRAAELSIGRSGLVALDEVAFAKVISGVDGVRAWRQEADRWVVELDPGFAGATLEVPMVALRTGEGQWPAVRFAQGEARVDVSAQALTVK